MIKNQWLDEAEAEDIAYFRAKLLTPINSRLLKEAIELESVWAKNGTLDWMKGRWCRGTTAVLLESQRLSNEF